MLYRSFTYHVYFRKYRRKNLNPSFRIALYKWSQQLNQSVLWLFKSYLNIIGIFFSRVQSAPWISTSSVASRRYFPAFCEARMFITAFKTARHKFTSSTRLMISTLSHFFKSNLNTVPPTTRSSKWSLSYRFHHSVAVSISFIPHTRHMPRISHYFTFYN